MTSMNTPPRVIRITPENIQWGLLQVTCVVLLVLYLTYLWKRRHLYIKSWNVPGPLALPVIGSLHCLMVRSENIIIRITEVQEKYNGFLKFWFGPKLIYLISDPKHIDRVLNNPRMLHKDYLYRFLTQTLGPSLMTAPVPLWKKHRKTISPSFNQKILDSFVEVFSQQSEVCAEIILKQEKGKEIDIYGIMARCTLEILCETALGVKMDVQKTNADYGVMFDTIMELTFIKIFQPWYHCEFIWNLSPLSKVMRKNIKKFNDLTDKVIKENKDARKNKSGTPLFADDIDDAPKRKAFLDLILENSNFTDREIRDEISLFLFAGTDTTASALTCLFTVLGMYPDVQQKVYDEIVEIIGNDRLPQPEDLHHMKYTERVIKETLRLFPVGAFFLRAITEDTDFGDVVIPTGSSVFFGTVYIHRNPKYWPDPLKFDPDRFLPEEVAKRHPCSYIVFSFGSRNCIGMRYAIMAMKSVIAVLIRKIRFRSAYKSIDEIKLKANIVLRLIDGSKLTVEPRER